MDSARPNPRPRAASNTTINSYSSPLASRRRPGPSALSPASTVGASPAASYQSSIYQASNLSQPSFASPSYLSSFSTAPSVAGSSATVATTQPGGPARFKRGHARKKANPMTQVVPSANPHELDLMALEDPDEVFRLFGVRDVRGLEQRAHDAAAAKVAELRTMVGERYRDLLSAADSIVRMRAAAEKLVDRIERVEAGVNIGGSVGDTPTKRGAPKLLTRPSTSTPESERTLASPPTLSLTIQLLMSLPSLVHTLLESSSFLPAARLEGVGRVVYRELSSFSYDDDDEDAGSLKDTFPIIEKQWESIGSLGAVIARRATAELRSWDSQPITTAETLAAILMLENASFASSLTILLEARSKTLSSIFQSPPTPPKHSKSATREVDAIVSSLNDVLGLVLQTVAAATDIFGASDPATPSATTDDGLLLQLLREIEKPSGSAGTAVSPSLAPILCTVPNYPLLSRHLPPSILGFTPFLSIASSRKALSPSTAHAQIQAWLAQETERVIVGVQEWISTLHGGARTLSLIREAVRSSLAQAGPNGVALLSRLEATIEDRLEAVYKAHLAVLVTRVPACLEGLLEALKTSPADLDTAEFLLDTPLAFPPPAHYSMPSRIVQASDPFDGFLEEVVKRVQGRSPLIERGLGEFEAHARDLKEDLEGWLGGVEEEHAESGLRVRLREQYVNSANETLDGVYKAMQAVLESVANDTQKSLFLGNFTFMLAASKSFTRDLLLGSAPLQRSQESAILSEWQARLATLQAQSLVTWRREAVDRASKKLEESLTSIPSRTTSLWAWEASRGLSNGASSTLPLPSQPSPALLSSLRQLNTAIRKVGLHRTQSDRSIVNSLLAAYQSRALEVVKTFVATGLNKLEGGQKREVAVQVVWDLAFLRRFWGEVETAEWEAVTTQLLKSADADSVALETSALHYLQRTQTIFASLLVESSTTNISSAASAWLLLGTPSSSIGGNEFKSLVGVVKPGPRLGLLPTRG